ncbi:MAG: CDGSH iron-sulfur domain-containing protein [Nitrospinae bacterium]|nr:CDGSH iron-sulfur domain-containing protein [Nitrospinota bacterium]
MPEPKVAQKGLYVKEVAVGTYYWCACDHSNSQPSCDGAHKAAGFGGMPNIPMRVEVREAGPKPWCGCKHTKTPPYCDGTHATL